MAASAPVGLVKIIQLLTKEAGGAAFLAKHIDPDLLTHWDKKQFYQKGGADSLLWAIKEQAHSSRNLNKFLDKAWDRMHSEGQLQDDGYVQLEWDGKRTWRLKFRAEGPLWSRYSEEYYDDPDAHPTEAWEYMIEVPTREAFIDKDLDRFAKAMGARQEGFTNDGTEVSDMDDNYLYFVYNVRLQFTVDTEQLLSSVDKWVDQAGQSIRWG